jgi:hypothetical protein
MIIEQVSRFLAEANKGQADMSDEIIEEAVAAFRKAMNAHFKPKKDRVFEPYLSSIGRPLCQLQMEQSGAEREPPEWHFRMKMLFGDMTEIAAVAIMKAAGIPVVDEQKEVKWDSGYGEVRGKLDFNIEGEGVYDLKSASSYQYTYKFNQGDAFHKIREDDAFGYIVQGYLYGEGAGEKFKGWIVINKATGEWCIAPTPIADNSYRKEAIRTAQSNAKALAEGAEFKRCYEPVIESFNGKKTGNKYLDTTCSYCPYKNACWGKVTHMAQPKSKAKSPKKFYYIGDVNV